VVNVEDSAGNEVDGVTITPSSSPAGGGALKCDGTLSGSNVTVAPPCVPERAAPMYLAYYDADAEIGITITGSPALRAPLRVGEVTYIVVVQ